jgi:hypothetical protein
VKVIVDDRLKNENLGMSIPRSMPFEDVKKALLGRGIKLTLSERTLTAVRK